MRVVTGVTAELCQIHGIRVEDSSDGTGAYLNGTAQERWHNALIRRVNTKRVPDHAPACSWAGHGGLPNDTQ